MSRPKKEPPITLNLWQKILKITGEVGPMMKRGYNEKGEYGYVTHVQAMEELVPLQCKYGVIIEAPDAGELVYQARGENEFAITRVKFSFTIRDADKPEDFIVKHVWGEAIDNLDKGSAMACTLADKYLCLKLFRIATPELDPDSVSQERTPQTGHSKRKSKAMVVEGKIEVSARHQFASEILINGDWFTVVDAHLDCQLAPAMDAKQEVAIEFTKETGPNGDYYKVQRILKINGKDYDLTGQLEASIANVARKKANGIKIVMDPAGQ